MNYILVIDDSPTIRTSVKLAIEDVGYEIEMAENGEDALDKVRKIKGKGDDISLCVTDINMPVMDGIRFIKEFRTNDKFTPILVLTTESDDKMIEEGKKSGASGWLVKPFRPDVLVNTINKLIR